MKTSALKERIAAIGAENAALDARARKIREQITKNNAKIKRHQNELEYIEIKELKTAIAKSNTTVANVTAAIIGGGLTPVSATAAANGQTTAERKAPAPPSGDYGEPMEGK